MTVSMRMAVSGMAFGEQANYLFLVRTGIEVEVLPLKPVMFDNALWIFLTVQKGVYRGNLPKLMPDEQILII